MHFQQCTGDGQYVEQVEIDDQVTEYRQLGNGIDSAWILQLTRKTSCAGCL